VPSPWNVYVRRGIVGKLIIIVIIEAFHSALLVHNFRLVYIPHAVWNNVMWNKD